MTRSKSPAITLIFWRDIPVQVVAGAGDDVHRVKLGGRFQQAIDRAAMATGKTGTEDYLEDWRRDSQPLVGDPQEAAEAAAAELEDRHPKAVLDLLVANGGFKES